MLYLGQLLGVIIMIFWEIILQCLNICKNIDFWTCFGDYANKNLKKIYGKVILNICKKILQLRLNMKKKNDI